MLFFFSLAIWMPATLRTSADIPWALASGMDGSCLTISLATSSTILFVLIPSSPSSTVPLKYSLTALFQLWDDTLERLVPPYVHVLGLPVSSRFMQLGGMV